MDFSVSESQGAIVDLIQRIFSDKVTDDYHRAFAESTDTKSAGAFDSELWQVLAEAGVQGLCINERWGGMGFDMEEFCTVLEAQGRVLAPVPLLTSQVAALAIQNFGNEAQCGRYIPSAVTGEHHLAVSMDDAARGDLGALPIVDKSGRLHGVVHDVAYAEGAIAVVIPAIKYTGEKLVLLIDPMSAQVNRESQQGTNGEPRDTLQFDGLPVNDDQCLCCGNRADDAIEWIVQRTITGLAALQLGACQEALERTVAYTGERQQFGRPIASFQAITHRAADGYIDCEALRSAVWLSAWRLGAGMDCTAEARTAKWWAAEVGHRVGHTAQHLHGGIGADLEFPIHRYFLWTKQIEFTLGGAREQLAQLGLAMARNDQLGVRV